MVESIGRNALAPGSRAKPGASAKSRKFRCTKISKLPLNTLPLEKMKQNPMKSCSIRSSIPGQHALVLLVSLFIGGIGWTSRLIGKDLFGESLATLAQSDSKSVTADPAKNKPNTLASTAETERAALEFVGQHHPQMLELLQFLKGRQPAQYPQALKEMVRSQQRLESLAKRDLEMYQVELQLWQIRSDLRLLAAEISVKATIKDQTDERMQRLTALVEQEASQELVRLKLLKQRTQRELQRLDEQIADLTDSSDERVAKNLKLWQSRITKQSRHK